MTDDQLRTIFGDATVVQAVFWILAVGLLLAVVIKLWPALSVLVTIVDALKNLPAKLKLVDEIHHEVRPNTGTSMNDSLRRVETEQHRQALVLHEHTTKLDEQSDKLAGLKDLMEDADAELAERVDDLENTFNPGRDSNE